MDKIQAQKEKEVMSDEALLLYTHFIGLFTGVFTSMAAYYMTEHVGYSMLICLIVAPIVLFLIGKLHFYVVDKRR